MKRTSRFPKTFLSPFYHVVFSLMMFGSLNLSAQEQPQRPSLEDLTRTRTGIIQWAWRSIGEGTYAIQHSPSAGNPKWETIGFRQGAGTVETWRVPMDPRASHEFYRLVWFPPEAALSVRLRFQPQSFQDPQRWWKPLFADYPADPQQEAMFDLVAEHRALPEELDGEPGYFLGGSNRSDDLFMALYMPIEGLAAETTYEVELSVTLASNIPTGLVGIGGSPGDSVYVKGGVSSEEPNGEIIDEWWRPTVDKGNQFSNGSEGVTLGTIAKPEDGNDHWVLIERTTGRKPIIATTNPEGQLWTFVGTDSGFEGRTEIYFHSVTVTLSPAL